MMSFAKYIILFSLLLSAFQLAAEDLFFSRVFRQDSNRRELLFYHYNEILIDSERNILKHYYVLPDSTISVIDAVILENGEFRQAQSQFLEVEEVGTVIRNGENMILRFQKGEKIKERKLAYPPDLLVGPLFNDHIRQN